MADYRLDLSQTTAPAGDDLFGIWDHAPAAEDDEDGIWDKPTGDDLSFAAGAQSGSADATWQIALPAGQEEAQNLLDAQQQALELTLHNLDDAEKRLDQVDTGLSFSAAAGPEADLQAAMNAFSPGLPFFAAEVQERQGISARWHAFVAQTEQLLTQFAHVETAVGGQLISRTAVSWTSDFETRVINASPKNSQLHQQAVQLALNTRAAMLRLLIVITTGAAKLALRLAVPGAQLLLLPAVYQFIRDVLKELQHVRDAVQQ